jgi:hypothetical protein
VLTSNFITLISLYEESFSSEESSLFYYIRLNVGGFACLFFLSIKSVPLVNLPSTEVVRLSFLTCG